MTKKISINYLFINIIFFSTLFFIFLWPIRFYDLSIKYVLLLALIPILFNTYSSFNNLKKKYLISILLLLFLISHLLITNNLKHISINSILEIIFLSFMTLFCLIYYKYIKDNKIKFIIFFISIFLSSSIFSIFNFRFDDPYFCGGVPDYFHLFKNHVIQSHINVQQSDSHLWLDPNYLKTITFKLSSFKISFKEFIFEENSHLGMVAVPILVYSIFQIKSFNKYSKIIIFIFAIICLVKSSTTLIAGLIISLLYLTLINYNNFSFKKKIKISLFIGFLICIFFFDANCRNKISPSYYGKNIISNDKAEVINDTFNTKGSLSSALTYKFLKFALNSFKNNIIGTGIGTFERESIIYSDKNKFGIPSFDTFNLKDGTNNFNKLIVEFGVFGLLLYLIVFLYSLKKNIRFDEKCFLIPFIITQSLRGAGYYNGGFALIFIILLISYFASFKTIK